MKTKEERKDAKLRGRIYRCYPLCVCTNSFQFSELTHGFIQSVVVNGQLQAIDTFIERFFLEFAEVLRIIRG